MGRLLLFPTMRSVTITIGKPIAGGSENTQHSQVESAPFDYPEPLVDGPRPATSTRELAMRLGEGFPVRRLIGRLRC